MKKNDFLIKRETRSNEYSFTEKKRSKVPLGILVFMAIFVLNGTSACGNNVPAKAGVIAYHPTLIGSHTDAYIHLANYAHDRWNLNLVNDYPLKITYNGKTVTFIADGYDVSNKIAYEWLAAPEYRTNFSDNIHLSPSEISNIKNSKFGDYYIVPIKSMFVEESENEFWMMMSDFKKDKNKGGSQK